MINGLQYDWVYHEHIFYYSIHALNTLLSKHGLRIFDVENTGLHAGSRRYFVCKDLRKTKPSVIEAIKQDEGLCNSDTFKNFSTKAFLHRELLTNLINNLLEQGRRIVGYGACGRANTLMQFCGITSEMVSFIVDDSPVKHHLFTPSSHIEILPPESLNEDDVILLFAWSFAEDILSRYRNDVIIPFPMPELIKRTA
jgi:hypothetical protein